MKCLVVDDSAVVRRLVIRSLKAIGITEIVEARDGSEALQRCDDSIGLIITDWNMPVMGGLELVKSVRARDTTGKKLVLMMTTEGAAEDLVDGIEAGVNGSIFKPFTPEAFRDKINQITVASSP